MDGCKVKLVVGGCLCYEVPSLAIVGPHAAGPSRRTHQAVQPVILCSQCADDAGTIRRQAFAQVRPNGKHRRSIVAIDARIQRNIETALPIQHPLTEILRRVQLAPRCHSKDGIRIPDVVQPIIAGDKHIVALAG